MRILVLGGTAWLGGHVATTAAELGHEVTCLARGSAASAPPGIAFTRGDRDEPDAYAEVRRGRWDLVVDVSRQPGHVRRAVEALEPSSGAYVMVSSGNVYADHSTPGEDETAALLLPLEGDVMHDMTTYGPAKVACEQHVLRAFGSDRSLIARVGLIGGPGDPFDRSGYWPVRFARPSAADGRVLVPDACDLLSAVIDVRDLAGWLVEAPAGGLRGAFDVVGPTLPLAHHLEVARRVACHDGPVVAASEQWLLAQGVEPWMGPRSLPLWLPDPA